MKTIKGSELVDREFEVLEDGTLRLIENKSKRFIPDIKEDYWYLENGEVVFDKNDDADIDNWIMDHQPVFKTKEECEEYKKFLELLDKYKCDLDWKDEDKEKFYLYYDYSRNCVNLLSNNTCQKHGTFYFKLRTDVEEFIEKAGEGNIKRFMFDIWE